MVEFRKFDPYGVLGGGGPPSKVAKVAKAERTLGALATLAGASGDKLCRARAGTSVPDPWGDAEEERAAFLEYGGNLPRDWAEAFARLNCCDAPAGVSAEHWLRFLNDCGAFLDGGWAIRAHQMGWSPLDLLGCDRRHSVVDIETSGLLWQIGGGKLILLTSNTAVVEDPSGKSKRFVRLPVRAGLVLAWRPVRSIGGWGIRGNSSTTP